MSEMSRLRPTVCTNRAAPVIGPCLTALRESGQAAATLVVLSGLSGNTLAERCREVRRLIPEATVLVESEGGVSRARNLALAEVPGAHVVAFIDDDAVIAGSWRHAMESTWAQAGPQVAAVGGPVKPLFLAPRPPWLSDYLLGGLSIIDNGPHLRALNGSDGALFGANLSVIAGHGLAVGGFDPRRGPLGAGPGFGDDIEFQSRLRANGMQVLYDPDAAVFHRIGVERLRRRALLERRYAQGREQRRSGASTPGPRTIWGLCVSAARAGRHAVGGDSAASMAHLAYTAQCVGVVCEPWHERVAGVKVRLPPNRR